LFPAVRAPKKLLASLALYLAAQRLKDDRWRYQSPSRIARFYRNLGW